MTEWKDAGIKEIPVFSYSDENNKGHDWTVMTSDDGILVFLNGVSGVFIPEKILFQLMNHEGK